MDRTLVLSVGLDLDLSCRGGGLAIFSGLSEISNLRQAKAKNSDKNQIFALISYAIKNVLLT